MDHAESQSGGFAFGAAFQSYAYSWLFSFVTTLLGAAIANGIWNVPFFQVVNVNLSIALSVAILVLGLNTLGLVLSLPSGQPGLIGVGLFGVLLSLLIPFAPIAAFQLYALFGGLPIADQSFIYDDFMNAIKTVAGWAGQLSVMQPPPGSSEKAVDLILGMKMDTLRDTLAIVASALAIISFFIRGSVSAMTFKPAVHDFRFADAEIEEPPVEQLAELLPA